MKKIAATIACIVTVIAANTMFLFADDNSVNAATLANDTVSAQTTTTQHSNVTSSEGTQSGIYTASAAGVTPDNPLYVFDKLMESIQVTLTFQSEEKAVLLVSFANERLAEASVLDDESKVELFEDIMKAYLEVLEKANVQIKEAAEEGKNVKPIIQDIKLTQDSAQTITVSIEGKVLPESAEQLKAEVSTVVKETLAVEAFAVAKENFFESKKQFELAKEEFNKAVESKDEALIKAAQEKLALAEKNKDEKELTKDLIEVRKEAVKDQEEHNKKELEEKNKEAEMLKEKVEKLKEKAEKKAEKAEEKVKKEAEKAREKAKKAYEKSKGDDDKGDDED